MSIVDQIAPSCAWVAANADHVKINTAKIPEYARFIVSKYPVTTEMGGDCHYRSGDREDTAAYILALDSINFGSGYFRIAKEYGFELEYAVIAGALKKEFEQGRMNKPQLWAKATREDFSRLLGIPLDQHPRLDGLMTAFAEHLCETGHRIMADYGGRVLALAEEAEYSALKLADTVAAWKGFHDVHAYKGKQIPILKRAQILAADMNLSLSGFKDMDALTIFADNMVPHVLRCDEILQYTSVLAGKIDGGVPLVSGSAEEIEIRAVAIHAVELMKKEVEGFTSVNLDHMLWHRGYEPELYRKPSHRAPTTNY